MTVKPATPAAPEVTGAPPPSAAWFRRSQAAGRVGSSAIREILAVVERPGVLSLAGGLPAPETFPAAAVAAATAAELDDDPAGALQYATTRGHEPLRRWVAQHHRAQVAADQVLITHGSQQALELFARAVVDPGDAVVMAEPGYVGAVQAFRLAGAELVGLPVGPEGLDVDVLARRLAAGLRPRAVYVVANFDNPSGATSSAAGRAALAALADRYGFVIVDDDPYGALRWSGAEPVALAHLSDQVVTLGSTSKVLCPGLRIGWAVGPAPILEAMEVVKQATDLHTSTLSQRVVHRVLARPGFLAGHVAGLRATYQQRAEVLVAALRARFGSRSVAVEPQGGMFVWMALPGVDTAALLPDAVARGVAFVPGAAFAVGGVSGGAGRTGGLAAPASGPLVNGMRLSFATLAPPDLVAAVDRLATSVATSVAGSVAGSVAAG